MSNTLTITARRDGFRRAGRAWSTEPTTVEASDFSEEQITALRSDPMLTVSENGKAGGASPSDDDLSVDDVIAAIRRLDPNNPEHYTKSGKPQTDALSESLGREVSAKLRDKAFAQVESS